MSNNLVRRDFIKLSALGAASLTLPGLSFGSQKKNNASQETGKNKNIISSPPMGWNSFDSYGVYLHEEAAYKNLEELAKTYLPFGYEYFVIDNGWFGEYDLIPGTKYPAEKHASDVNINDYGLLQPSKCYFPNGIKPIINRAHKLGLKFGLHLMRGIPRKAVELNLPIKGTKYRARDIADTNSICRWCSYNYGVDMSRPGAQEFYNSLVNQLAEWGVDFIKADDITGFPKEIIGLANAIEQNPRDIVFSLSPGGSTVLYNLPYYKRANMVRITKDIWDRVDDLDKAFTSWEVFQGTGNEVFYPDLDMIPFGNLMQMTPAEYYEDNEDAVRLAGHGYKRKSQFTQSQHYTFITIRALGGSPLFIGGDLPTMDNFSQKLLTNKEMIACSQNGVVGFNIYKKDSFEIWLTPDKKIYGKGWLGIFNRNKMNKIISLDKNDFKFRDSVNYKIYDVWNEQEISFNNNKVEFDIPADGVVFLKFQEA